MPEPGIEAILVLSGVQVRSNTLTQHKGNPVKHFVRFISG